MNGVPRSHGVTLIELLIVVSILGVVALAAIPVLSSGGVKRLDVATGEVVAALRYARSQALLTGEVYGLEVDVDKETIEVFKPDLTTDPISKSNLIYHPVDRKPYRLDLDDDSMTAGVTIADDTLPFLYFPDKYKKDLYFNAGGIPVRIEVTDGSTVPLIEGAILLAYKGIQRTVRITAISGRVTVE